MHVRHPHPRSAFRWLLPRRTVRYRLAVVYGGLFVVCGAVLLAVTGLLWGRATGGRYVVAAPAPVRILAIAVPPRSFGSASGITQVNVHQARPIGPNLQQIRRVTAQLRIVAAGQRSSDLHQLLLYSGIGLAIMVMLASALGWLAAGRVLRPLRTITSAVRDISATNLHKRLDLGGPDDELKLLGDTFDQLLERLDRSFQSQRLFVANASHELRTP
ncbi:MAG TPA: HAMP domain-containing protein, partial [Acidimicrobiales bacterium]|nr:HAMP domain-containing protein [Acidimicrobiales bacterium]